jgi:carboxymethylenebutenolidase
MLGRYAALLVLLVAGWAHAEETIIRTLHTTASPLQCFRALSEDWIYLQWSKAANATFGIAPETPWRVTMGPAEIEEGMIKVLDPGSVFEYTEILDDGTTTARFEFTRTDSGTTIQLRQVIPWGAGQSLRAAMILGQRWDLRLRLLVNYLNAWPVSYLKSPPGDGPYPALILLHDRFGQSKDVREMANALANRGYVVCCVDMFNGDRTSDMNEAQRFMTLVKDEAASREAVKVYEKLKTLKNVKKDRIGVLGMGYGGRIAFRAAAELPGLRAGTAWYPDQLPADSLLQRVAANFLVVHPASSSNQPTAMAEQFSQTLMQQGVRAENVLVIGEAGFVDPANGSSYSANATADALRTTLNFFDRVLKL